jgi:hypothetical protein
MDTNLNEILSECYKSKQNRNILRKNIYIVINNIKKMDKALMKI